MALEKLFNALTKLDLAAGNQVSNRTFKNGNARKLAITFPRLSLSGLRQHVFDDLWLAHLIFHLCDDPPIKLDDFLVTLDQAFLFSRVIYRGRTSSGACDPSIRWKTTNQSRLWRKHANKNPLEKMCNTKTCLQRLGYVLKYHLKNLCSLSKYHLLSFVGRCLLI